MTYPPPVHQYLSPNDNHLHGVAKKRWRALGLDHSDDVLSTLTLMHCIDQISESSIQTWFRRNFLLDQKEVSREAIASVIDAEKKLDKNRANYYELCLAEYEAQILDDQRRLVFLQDGKPKGLKHALDGVHWTQYKK